MCILCDQGKPQNHSRSQLGRRDFLKVSSAAAAGAGMGLFAAPPARADQNNEPPPYDHGRHGRRYVIRNGHVMTIIVDDDAKGRAMKGLIGFQIHTGPPMKIEYRNIYLKRL